MATLRDAEDVDTLLEPFTPVSPNLWTRQQGAKESRCQSSVLKSGILESNVLLY